MEDTQAEGQAAVRTSEEICLHFYNDQLADIVGLRSNLEEADTKICRMQLMPLQMATELV